MNYALAREMYGMPWMVDASTFGTLNNLVKDFRNGVSFNAPSEKANFISMWNLTSGTMIIDRTYQLRADYADDLVYVINLNGPITKGGGDSSYGVKDLVASMNKFQGDNRVKGGIILADSGGGSSLAMEYMSYAVKNSLKPVVGLIERGGIACSACAGILSNCDYIFAESENSTVGSFGTMMSISGVPNGEKDASGEKQMTFYATASTQKNKWYEEAINNNNSALVISEILDPVNERFLAMVKANRPQILESQLDGSTYNAGDVVGTIIDAIGNFQDAVNKVLEISNKQSKFSPSNKKSKQPAMKVDEIKSQFPESHTAIFNAGRDAERERVKSWNVWSEVDPESVKKGIDEGRELTNSETQGFLLKATKQEALNGLKNDSPKSVVTPEAVTDPKATVVDEADKAEIESIYGKFIKTPSLN